MPIIYVLLLCGLPGGAPCQQLQGMSWPTLELCQMTAHADRNIPAWAPASAFNTYYKCEPKKGSLR